MRRRRWYRRKYGVRFRSGAATTFNEKVNWRILHDRRGLLLGTCDKLSMKEHALRSAPDLVRVPRTLWTGTDVRELAAVDLPERWVLKPNHSTKLVFLGEGRPDTEILARETRGWLEEDVAARTGEWAYSAARPLLLAEEFVGVPGEVPNDYKLYVFDGVPRLVQVHTARFVHHQCRVYTPSWEPLDWWTGYPPGPEVPRPANLGLMLEAGGRLGEGFDMMRVDLYEQDGLLWFGELTPYPGSGLLDFGPEMDAQLGAWWTLPGRTR